MKNFSATAAGFLVSMVISLAAWSQSQGFSQFYYEESNAISFQQRYAAAPSGSWEETQYRQQRQRIPYREVY